MPDRQGDWIQTYTGGMFWPLDPRPEEVRLDDIVHALSHICRYGGHCRLFYSVAQHSVLVADIASQVSNDPLVMIYALLHDAAEAYVGDMVRPLKRFMPDYCAIENKVHSTILERFGLPLPVSRMIDIINDADRHALVTEKRDLMYDEPAPWNIRGIEQPGRINPLLPVDAKSLYFRALVDAGLKFDG